MVFDCNLPIFDILLPPATYLPPPYFAHVQGVSEQGWQVADGFAKK